MEQKTLDVLVHQAKKAIQHNESQRQHLAAPIAKIEELLRSLGRYTDVILDMDSFGRPTLKLSSDGQRVSVTVVEYVVKERAHGIDEVPDGRPPYRGLAAAPLAVRKWFVENFELVLQSITAAHEADTQAMGESIRALSCILS